MVRMFHDVELQKNYHMEESESAGVQDPEAVVLSRDDGWNVLHASDYKQFRETREANEERDK
jgi:hypothetical protein